MAKFIYLCLIITVNMVIIQLIFSKAFLASTTIYNSPQGVSLLCPPYGEFLAHPNPTRQEESQPGLTPDGTGTVVDNVTNEDSAEFFTIFTEDGSEFFLIVDRQQQSDNVYLLNTVTVEDLVEFTQHQLR